MQLNPGETFVIAHQIGNHTDETTYYVRAVIRNAKTDAIVLTLNLTEKAARRFTGEWQVMADVSGQGMWITITTAVYTDSGYTTKSENYAEEQHEYLVQARVNPNMGLGGGMQAGGEDIDYKKIRKILREELAEAGITPAIVNAEEAILKRINAIEIPKPKDFNLEPVLEGLRAQAVSVKEVSVAIAALPKPEKVVFDEVKEHVVDIAKQLVKTIRDATKGLGDIDANQKGAYKEVLGLKTQLSSLVEAYNSTGEEEESRVYISGPKKRIEAKQAPDMGLPDVSHILRRGIIRNKEKFRLPVKK